VLIYLGLMLVALLVVSVVMRYDMYDRAPTWLLLLTILVGAAGMGMSFATKHALQSLYPVLKDTLPHAVAAGFGEEFGKLAVVVLVIGCMRRKLHDPIDGLVFGAMAGLGAAVFESCYMLPRDVPLEGVPALAVAGPELVRVFMHTVWGAIVGFPMGLIALHRRGMRVLLLCYVMSAVLHTGWNAMVGFVSVQGSHERWTAGGIVVLSSAMFGLFVLIGNEWSRRRFDPDGANRLVGDVVAAKLRI